MKAGKKTPKKLDAEYIQTKINLIEQGLPIDISEEELKALEETFRGARSFYIDILVGLHDRKGVGEDVDHHIIEESKNLAGIEMALRKVDDFRKEHWKKIKNTA
jgi:uncharacterized protein (UPF0212 family)